MKEKSSFIKRFVGNKAFYAAVLAIALPVMAQNGITQFVGVLDNLMVGRIGTEQMSGVAIANQLIFVFNLCIFGGLSGAGIFGAQFAGKRDNDGIRYVFRFKLIVCIIVCCLSVALLSFLDAPLINLFLHEGRRSQAEEHMSELCFSALFRMPFRNVMRQVCVKQAKP